MKTFVNTVPAEHQMAGTDEVSFLGEREAPLKILVLGNSITRHAPSEAIGWHGDWGMAASAPQKDYVHRLFAMLKESGAEPYMMVRQASHWERHFREADCLSAYEDERAFGADIVIFRLGENVGRTSSEEFRDAILRLLGFVMPVGARAVLTTCFWKNDIRDRAIREAAEALGSPCADIGCTDEALMALGAFSHRGVAAHPGDEGMAMIAEKIFACFSVL